MNAIRYPLIEAGMKSTRHHNCCCSFRPKPSENCAGGAIAWLSLIKFLTTVHHNSGVLPSTTSYHCFCLAFLLDSWQGLLTIDFLGADQ